METRGDEDTAPVRRRSTARPPRPRPGLQLKMPPLTRPQLITAAAVLVLGTAAAIAVLTSDSTVTVRGSLTLNFGAYIPDGTGGCTASSGYDDISTGTAVTIGDQTGATIAVGQLGPGRTIGNSANFDAGCTFAFNVQAPGGRQLYTVTVSHRGTQVFRPDQIGAADMTLGNTVADLGLG